MASTLRRSDPKLSASLLKNYSYVHSDGIQESLSGTPLQLNGHFYDISSQAFLTKENFKPLICCVLNACCQHKFLLADRILTAIITCFTVAPNLYNTLVDNEYVNNMEMLFMNICKIKDWDRSVPCVRLLNACTQTMIEHNRRANLDRIYRRILRKICNAIAKYHITIDDKGSDTTFELRNLYEAVSLLRNLLLLLLHVGINFYVDIEPFIRSIRDIKCIVIISVARQIALGTTDVESVFKCIDTVYNNPLIWRKCMLKVSYTDQRMIDNDIVLLNIHDAVASFTRTNITILPIDTMDMAIELPLISCIDFQDKNDSLIFYFDVNLTYIKENLPNKVACGFRHQLAMQYRFIVTCMKTSCIKKLEYDKAVIDFYKERVNCDAYISRCTTSDAIISGTIQKGSINPITKCSYISMELPVNNHIYSAPYISYSTIGEETPYTALQWQTPTLHHQYLTKSGQNSPYGSTLPPSFNRGTTTRAFGTPLMDEKSIKSKTNIYEASCHSSQKKKSSVAIIQLPQEGPFMAVADKMEQSGQDERTNITNDIDHVENTESITITQKDINQTNDAKAVCNIAEVLPDNSSNHSYEITSKETDPGPSKEAVFHVFMHKVPLKRKRAIKKRKTSELSKAGSPVPLRNYITYNPTQINNDGDKQSLIKHLKSATELLKKRRRATCDFANKAFEDLRLSIETRFHLLLSQRQERWNHLNNIYKQKLNDISKGIECDFRIPSIHEVAHQDSNDVNYILQQNSESG